MGNCLDSTITHVLQDIGILQMSHIHLFRNSWQQGKTSFAGKYEKKPEKWSIRGIYQRNAFPVE